MRLTFLGTGTSFGVPVVGCECRVCLSDDPADTRTRHGALLELEEGNLLIDAPPELRMQLLATQTTLVDAAWFTHDHADHCHGIDDLRAFTTRNRPDIPAYVPDIYENQFKTRFNYIFNNQYQPPKGTIKPRIKLCPFGPETPIDILGQQFSPVIVPHGHTHSYGFRVGNLGYVTDAKSLPDRALGILQGVNVLVLNALWFGNPHPTHFNVEEAVEAAALIGAERTFLTHISHKVTHKELIENLPANVQPAFDGLKVEIK